MAYTEFYCQTTGSNLNAGSTTNNTAAFTYASGNWVAGTGVFTVASGNPSSDGVAVGDFASVYADGSTVTGFVGRVTARDATTITVSLTAKAGTAPTDGTGNRTLKIGGAWKGPNGTEAFPFGFVQSTLTDASSNVPRVNFKNGTNYAITAAMTHGNAGPIVWEGYTTSAGDGGRAIIDGGTSGASYILLTVSAANNDLNCLIFQNNGATGTAAGLTLSGTECVVWQCVVHDVRGPGMNLTSANNIVVECEVYLAGQGNGSSTGGFTCSAGNHFLRCISHDNNQANTTGFQITTSGPTILGECIADTNGSHGFTCTGTNACSLVRCDAYNNTGDGIRLANSAAGNFYIDSCNLVKNGGYGINGSTANGRNGRVINCGFGSGTQANTSGTTTGLSGMTLSGSVSYAADVTPWTDPANGDFRISLATAKGAGRGTFVQTQSSYAGAVAYPDIGAAQHVDAGGSTGIGRLVGNGLVG